MAGVQCLKRLYFQVHDPLPASALDEMQQTVVEQGRMVGLEAHRAFPGGVNVAEVPGDLQRALATTRTLVTRREAPAIFEATFEHDGVLVRTDVLQPGGRTGFRLIEVKSSTSVKPHYLHDVAIQRHVLSGAGVEVESESLMYLNRNYVFDGERYDVRTLFVSETVDPADAVGEAEISDRLTEQFRILNQRRAPDIAPGKHCDDPYRCEFYERCNPGIATDHISLVPGLRAKKLKSLLDAGITSIHQVPETFQLTERQRRAVDCVKSGKPFIGPELATKIAHLRYPLCFMDFETVSPALPRFAGMAPYDPIPFQWSVHRQEKSGDPVQHFAYLAEDAGDPRRAFAASLCQALSGAGSVLVYNKAFETSRLHDLACWLPDHRVSLESIKRKLWDLLEAIRQNVYHPDFAGSFSLKSVLPAFLPKMSYAGLEVSEGRAAGLAWQRFTDPATAQSEKARLKSALLAYCEQDTSALVRLLEVLKTCV